MIRRQHDIERYLRGEMTAQEMHALEKEALDDPFLSDALEGAQNTDADHFIFDLRELKSSVAHRSGRRGPRIISMWKWSIGIAATLLLVAVSGLYMIRNLSDRNAIMAENIEDADLSVFETGKYDTLEIVMPRVKTVIATAEPIGTTHARRQSVRRNVQREAEANLTDPTSIQIQRQAEAEDNASLTSSSALSLNLRVIKGTVTSSEDGSVLPGVNVVVKGTNTGTITDSEGKYEITVSQADQKLEFSFIGVKSIEAETRNKTNVNVSLTPDYESLSEVVVTGKGIIKEDKDKTYNLAEPEGGKDAYTKYLQQKLIYPEQALKNEVEGRVTIQFTVDDKGTLSNFKVLNSLGFGCDDEAIRLIREGPAWSPSKKNDKAVAEEVKVGLKFDIPNKN